MRNIGASIGTSMVTTLLARVAQFHQVHLVDRVSAGEPALNAAITGLAKGLMASGVEATQALEQATGRVYQLVIAQATLLAYVDTFRFLAYGAGLMFFLSFALKRNDPGGGRSAPAE
jgi:DHA2 family multidrug resistance protein